jgi:hypothetical protein
MTGASGDVDRDVLPAPEEVAAAVLACPRVVSLAAGRPGDRVEGRGADVEVATYRPGPRLPGVRVRADGIVVRVVGRYGCSTAEIGDEVRAAVLAVAAAAGVPDRPVDVLIDDLEFGGPGTDSAAWSRPGAAAVLPSDVSTGRVTTSKKASAGHHGKAAKKSKKSRQ